MDTLRYLSFRPLLAVYGNPSLLGTSQSNCRWHLAASTNLSMVLILAIYSLTLVRYICFANSICFSFHDKTRYDINLVAARQHIVPSGISSALAHIENLARDLYRWKKTIPKNSLFFWWREMDSNHRSKMQQIYSLPPLATREPLHIQLKLELVMGLEPATCWLQISCSANWATPAQAWEKVQSSISP